MGPRQTHHSEPGGKGTGWAQNVLDAGAGPQAPSFEIGSVNIGSILYHYLFHVTIFQKVYIYKVTLYIR